MLRKSLGFAIALAFVMNTAASARTVKPRAPSGIADNSSITGPRIQLAGMPGAYYQQIQPGYPQSPPGY